jgi:signal transduction histidine kinase
MRAAVGWIAAGCIVGRLSTEIESAASRIHALVAAVKGFTHLDQTPASMLVDIGQGLRDTVAVLRGKARSRSIGVTLDLPPELPRVPGFGGELNQVWANLLENALDAAPESGRVAVSVAREPNTVVVRVVDDGPGVPAAIRDRIFDPFFTTKPVGHGVGLGLDIARRIVERHDGWIELDSRPGRTEFRVTLPAAA